MATKTKQELTDAIASAAAKIIRRPQKAWRNDIQSIATDLVDTLFDMNQYIKKTQFDERVTTKKTIQFTRESFYEFSDLNDSTSSIDGGALQNSTSGEFRLHTDGAEANSYIKLETNRRGEYIAGQEAESSTGIRIPSQTISGDGAIKWGYYDTNDGIGFQYDADGLKAWYKKNGNTTYITRDSFNYDKLDGNGPSGITYAPEEGIIYFCNFSWYGYGDIFWNIAKTRGNIAAINPDPSTQLLHTASSFTGTKISNPNLPLTVEVDNGGTAQALEVFVGGRQFSTYGDIARRSIEFVEPLENWQLTASAGSWEPLAVIRRNTSFSNTPNIVLKDIELVTNQPISIKTTLHREVGTGNFSPPTSYSSADSAAEIAFTGSLSSSLGGDTNGFQIPPYIIANDTNEAGGRTEISSVSGDGASVTLPSGKAFVVWGRYTGTTPTISLVIRWEENR